MRLRVLRAERGLSLTEAAERAGIQRQTLALLERGERHPHDPTLAKIAKGYGVPIEGLLEEPALAGAPGKVPIEGLLEEPALAGAPGKDEAPDTGPSALAPWATYARRLAARARSHTADPHSPAFRDAWAALFFVEERNRDAAELWGMLFEEELGGEAYADEPFAALNAVLAALEELAEALAEAQRRAEQMAAGFAESEIGQARRRTTEAAAQREQAAERVSSRLERRGA
jgi:transcriptional regulator with XRE-family HTH domain